jgi:hypothetical protein
MFKFTTDFECLIKPILPKLFSYFMKKNTTILIIACFIFLTKETKSQIILSENFEGVFPPNGWTMINASQFSQGWTQNIFSFNAASGSKSMVCNVGSSDANAWSFTPSLSMNPNTLYRVSYYYRSDLSGGTIGKFKLTLGSTPTIASQNRILHDYPSIQNGSNFFQRIDTISVPSSGNYNFAFHCYSNANQGRIFIDSVVISAIIPTPCSGIPAPVIASAPSDVVPGANFTLSLAGNYLLYSGLSFQWQSSLIGANNFSNISGANTPTFITSEIVNTDFRCVVTCSNGSSSTISNIATVICSNSGTSFRLKNSGSNNLSSIYGMHFLSPSTGFVAFSRSIGYTVDSGQTYVNRNFTTTNTNYNGYSVNLLFGFEATGIYAFSQDSLLAYGNFGAEPAILFSANQGVNWKVVFWQPFDLDMTLSNTINDIKFWNSTRGIAINGKYILQTINRGQTWSIVAQAPSAINTRFSKITLPQNFIGYVSAGDKIYKLDASNIWYPISSSFPPNTNLDISSISFVNPNVGYIINAADVGVYKTTNGGINWVKMNDGTIMPVGATDVHFVNETTGFVSQPYAYEVFKTTNSGITWEKCKKNTTLQNGNYGMTRMFFLDNQKAWAGGKVDYLMMTTTGGSPTFPKANFKIDTINFTPTGMVNLTNLSKPYYQHKWFVNGVLLNSSFNTSYLHNTYSNSDTIKLVVNNGLETDTSIQILNSPPIPLINSFTPNVGTLGTLVVITGTNFSTVTNISFGGIPAASFSIISPTQINAYIGNGASGSVLVTNGFNQSTLPGFTYYAPVTSNISYSLSDSIICKSKSITVTVHNAQPNVRYQLVDSLLNVFGSISGGGNGGNLSFQTIPITITKRYYVVGSLIGFMGPNGFSNRKTILVEHTKSSFSANRINIAPTEKVNFNNLSVEAQSYNWIFNQDGNIGNSTAINPNNIFYSSTGQKTLSLISTSANGCKDTLNSDAVFVYTKPVFDEICYALNVNDSDYVYYSYGDKANKILLANDNGYYVSGFGDRPLLKSRYGNNKVIDLVDQTGSSYLAKYTTNGVLSWYTYTKSYGKFDAVEKDENGNIYIIGNCIVDKHLKLPNGDSLRIAATPADTLPYYSGKSNSFILKLDSLGNYLWHSVIADLNGVSGLPANLSFKTKIKIKNNKILIAGNFNNKVSYSRNGFSQVLFNLLDTIGYNNNSFLQNQFVINLKTDGSLQWSTYFIVSSVNEISEVTSLGIDNNENMYLSGCYENSIIIKDVGNFNTITYNQGSGGTATTNSYYLKFDSIGKLKWHTKAINPFGFRDVTFKDFVLDEVGNSYITGSNNYNNSSQFFTFTNSNGIDVNVPFSPYFLLKLSPEGLHKWSLGNKFSNNSGEVGGYSITYKNGFVYTTGGLGNLDYSSPLVQKPIFTSTNGANVSDSVLKNEFFIAKYDTLGILKRLNRSGQNVYDRLTIKNLIFDNYNNIIIQGINNSPTDSYYPISFFNQILQFNKTDLFFAKIDSNYCSQEIPLNADAGPDKSICNSQGVSIGVPAVFGNHYYWHSNPPGFESRVANPTVFTNVTTNYYLNVINASGFIKSDTVKVTIDQGPTANAGINQSICDGSSISIGAPPISGYYYNWTSIPSGFTSTSSNPTVSPSINTQYILKVSNNSLCMGTDTVSIAVSSQFVPNVNIAISTTNPCSNTLTTFTAIPINGGSTPAYQWKVNNINVGTNSSTFTISTLQNGDQVKVVMTSSLACASPVNATSNTVTMTVTPSPVANAGNNVTICLGSNTQLSGSGGTSYSWSPSLGLSNANIANPIASPTSTTAYVLTVSNGNCISKDTLVVTVAQPIAPSVTISTPNNGICNGIATFTAIASNAGSNPSYQWQVNGLNVGTNNATYSTSNLQNNAQVKVIVTTNGCTTIPTATSNILTMTVTTLTQPIVSLNTNVLTVTNPEASVNYTWQVLNNSLWNNINPLATGISYTASQTGEYRVKAEKNPCTIYSASQVSARTNTLDSTLLYIYLNPNPARNLITIYRIEPSQNWDYVEVLNLSGQIMTSPLNIRNLRTRSIDVSKYLAGIYFVRFTNVDGRKISYRFIKN